MLTRYGMEGTLIYQLDAHCAAWAGPWWKSISSPRSLTNNCSAKWSRRNGTSSRKQATLAFAGGGRRNSRGVPGPFDSAEQLARAPRIVASRCCVRVPLPRQFPPRAGWRGASWTNFHAPSNAGGVLCRRNDGLGCSYCGYLLQGCMASGTRAGLAAARWSQTTATLRSSQEPPQPA